MIPLVLVGVTILGAAHFAVALTVPPPPTGSAPSGIITSTTGISALFCGIINWLFWGLIVFSIIMFLWGGYRYATSGGEPEKVGNANKTLLYAAIAVVVAVSAKGLPLLVSSFLGWTIGSACYF